MRHPIPGSSGRRAPHRRPSAAPPAVGLLAATLAGTVLFTGGCHTARRLAPPSPLRAASVAIYAVDVEFAEPLDRASAEDPSRYSLFPPGNPATPATITSATLIDTDSLHVVQLLVPDWLADTTKDDIPMVVQTHGVLDYFGVSTGERSVTFRTGLGYAQPMQAFFDARCSGCHGATNPGGAYRTDSYAALLGPGTSVTPNVVAGDPNCLVIVRCRPHNSMYNRAHLSFLDYEMILNWITVYLARS